MVMLNCTSCGQRLAETLNDCCQHNFFYLKEVYCAQCYITLQTQIKELEEKTVRLNQRLGELFD